MQIAIAPRQARTMLPVACSTMPMNVDASASIAPIERSMPPAVMTNTMPSARTPLSATVDEDVGDVSDG